MKFIPSSLAVFVAFAGLSLPASAQVVANLGSAANFAVLAGTAVTNTGSSLLDGDLGFSPGGTASGFPPGGFTGTPHAGDATAVTAQNSLTTAYNFLAGQAAMVDLTGQNLGGMVLNPGVYSFSTSAQLTGTLTLNGQSNANAAFIFQIGSTLTTASNSNVVFTNGGRAANTFWQVGSSATLGTSTSFAGNILAQTFITMNTGANIDGRLLARKGAVTLDTNNVTIPVAVPEPATTSVLIAGLIGLIVAVRKFRQPRTVQSPDQSRREVTA